MTSWIAAMESNVTASIFRAHGVLQHGGRERG